MSAPATPGPQQEELSYRIELWHHAEAGGGVELVLARALNAQLGMPSSTPSGKSIPIVA
jgi:hypothetical protein